VGGRGGGGGGEGVKERGRGSSREREPGRGRGGGGVGGGGGVEVIEAMRRGRRGEGGGRPRGQKGCEERERRVGNGGGGGERRRRSGRGGGGGAEGGKQTRRVSEVWGGNVRGLFLLQDEGYVAHPSRGGGGGWFLRGVVLFEKISFAGDPKGGRDRLRADHRLFRKKSRDDRCAASPQAHMQTFSLGGVTAEGKRKAEQTLDQWKYERRREKLVQGWGGAQTTRDL